MRKIYLLLFLAGLWFTSFGQHVHQPECLPHLCQQHKAVSPFGGTYPQNPLLWAYDVSYYKLDINVDPALAFISGSVEVGARVLTAGLETFVLELMDNMDVERVVSEGDDLGFLHQGNELLIALPRPAEQDQWLVLKIYYQGTPQGEGFFAGFSTGVSPFGQPVLWTLSQPLNARQWWPVKQVLEDKADSLEVIITTPAPYVAASNGLLVSRQDMENNMLRYHWKSRYPIAYYLISLAVSDYMEYNFHAPLDDEGSQVLVQNFIYNNPSYLDQQRSNLERTRAMMQVFSNLFGRYPFATEKYGHATAPMGGGMEHQTISTMAAFTFDLTSHELAHHWYGNSVTCASWSDIWINEGFASYSEYLAREFIQGRLMAQSWMQGVQQSVLSDPTGSVYVPALETANVWRIFNGRLSYRKGAAILHILRNEIHDDAVFFAIMEDFHQQFRDSVASGDDFFRVAEQHTGTSWQYFADQWYYGEGHPVFDLQWWQEGQTLYIRSRQQGSAANPSFFKTSLDIRLSQGGIAVDHRIRQEHPEQLFALAVEGRVDELTADPGNWLLKQLTITRLDQPPGLQIEVFPNPVDADFLIRTNAVASGEAYRLYDARGQLLARGLLQGTQTRVAVPAAAAGLLILEVSQKDAKPWRVKLLRIQK